MGAVYLPDVGCAMWDVGSGKGGGKEDISSEQERLTVIYFGQLTVEARAGGRKVT